MAGLLAWAADVVGRGGQSNEDDDSDSIPLIFTPEQQLYVRELDQKAASLSRSIQDLRLRLPPPDISQSLPHLHAHSLASNADLALQLNSHSATKEQAQLREMTLQEENAAFEKAISSYEDKIREKLQEANFLRSKLKELDLIEKNLSMELENVDADQSGKSSTGFQDAKAITAGEQDTEASKTALEKKLDLKKKELGSVEEIVQDLEKKWAQVQAEALNQPTPAQREKILDKQLHSLIEQLAGKQAQAEGLVSEIHKNEMELERLNGLWRSLEINTAGLNAAISRSGRSISEKGFMSADYMVDPQRRAPQSRTESLQRQMLLRSAFVLYILGLHILVFIKISF